MELVSYTLSKSRFVAAQHCGRRLWLETKLREQAAPSEGAAIDWGNKVGELARKLRPEGRLIGNAERFDVALQETQLALGENGDLTLFEPAFSASGMAARCDVLERRAGRYTLIEVKGATRKTQHHCTDVAFQMAALSAAGIAVERAVLALIDSSFTYQGGGDYGGLFRYEDVTAEAANLQETVSARAAKFQGILQGEEPEMGRGSHCRKPWPCGFAARCAAGEPEYPVGLLGLRSAQFSAAAASGGWKAIHDVPEEALETETARRIWRATISGQRILTGEAATSLGARRPAMQYLDFETWAPAIPRWRGTRPYQQLPFQWSLHTDHGEGAIEHAEFLDESGEFPARRAAEALIGATRHAYPIAVYTRFEHGVIDTMRALCPDLRNELASIQERLLDLHPMAKESYYHRDMRASWSIKAILPTFAPELDYSNLGEVQDGGRAVGAYEEIIEATTPLERKTSLARDLKDYCRRDTEAMIALVRLLSSA